MDLVENDPLADVGSLFTLGLSQLSKLKSSPLATPAQFSSPGLDFTSAIKSASECTGRTLGTDKPITVFEIRATAARSESLYGTLVCVHGWAMNDDVGVSNRTWSSFELTNALIAMMPSPPGRFSMTTGWPHFLAKRSAASRPPMSAPLPGPSDTMRHLC
jgi:hypothetical protein